MAIEDKLPVNPFEDETEDQMHNRVGRMIRENVDKRLADAPAEPQPDAPLIGQTARIIAELNTTGKDLDSMGYGLLAVRVKRLASELSDASDRTMSLVRAAEQRATRAALEAAARLCEKYANLCLGIAGDTAGHKLRDTAKDIRALSAPAQNVIKAPHEWGTCRDALDRLLCTYCANHVPAQTPSEEER